MRFFNCKGADKRREREREREREKKGLRLCDIVWAKCFISSLLMLLFQSTWLLWTVTRRLLQFSFSRNFVVLLRFPNRCTCKNKGLHFVLSCYLSFNHRYVVKWSKRSNNSTYRDYFFAECYLWFILIIDNCLFFRNICLILWIVYNYHCVIANYIFFRMKNSRKYVHIYQELLWYLKGHF